MYNFLPGTICGPYAKGRFPVKIQLPGDKRKVLKVLPRNLVLTNRKQVRGPRVRDDTVKKGGPYSLDQASVKMNLDKKNTLFWPLPPDVATHICRFLNHSDIPKLAKVSTAWKKALYSR